MGRDQQYSDQILQALDDHAIIAITDLKGKIIHVNDKFCEVSGYEKGELIGSDHRILNSGMHSKDFFKSMWETIKSGKTWKGEIRNRRKNGDFYWVQTTISAIRDHDGEVVQFLAVRTEITDQKLLVEIDEQIQEMGNIGGWVLDLNTNRVTWTKQTFVIHEVPPGESVPTEDAIKFYAPHERAKITKYVQDGIELGKPYDDEFEFITAKGNHRWVRAMGRAERDNKGNVAKLTGTFQDITDDKLMRLEKQKAAEQTQALNRLLQINSEPRENLNSKLRRSLRVLFELPWLSLSEKGGVFLVDNGELNLTVSENLGEKIETMCETVQSGQCLCGRAFKTAKTIHAGCVDDRHENTFEGISPHGHYNVPIKQGKKVIGVIVLYLVHGHEKNQEEITFLESCAEIFAQIIIGFRNEMELIKSRTEALVAEKAKSEFLANMSHEIRSPLNGILGMAQLFEQTELTEEQNEIVKTILNSGESLLTILNDVLDYAKIESDKLKLENIAFNLEETIKESVKLFGFQAKEKGVKLEAEFDLTGPFYLGDETRVRQILVNLISNAVKFTEKGSVAIRVKGTENSVEISVQDSGIGISKFAQKKLFGSFTQADSSITRRFGGSGLGLAICKKLSVLMQGDLSFESQKGKGTTFKLFLPLVLTEGLKTPKEIMNIDKSIASEFPHRILVVEDNLVNQRVITKILEKMGYEITLAENGKIALDLVERFEYSLILMDMQMPVMDGVTASKKINELELSHPPTIIAVTANVFAEDREKCIRAGMTDFLTKPVKKKDLLRVLSSYPNDFKKAG